MNKPQKRYDATFKRDAVELGVCDVTLRTWRNRHLARTQPIETDGKKISAQQLAQELRRTTGGGSSPRVSAPNQHDTSPHRSSKSTSNTVSVMAARGFTRYFAGKASRPAKIAWCV
ncbi:MAG TPA: hypothetical protein VKS19_03355 [Verrucomicrobiae bacterium]|nr:hypothetical protein [Verrucomicrobiae bacterium]